MKQGDLVKMKYSSWWKVRSRIKEYTEMCGIVYEIHGSAIKILMPDSKIKTSLTDYWEKIET